MKRENLHQPFEISFSELDESLLKEHEHTFFELVYILSGTGIQWINNNMFPYHDGHLFMITPEIRILSKSIQQLSLSTSSLTTYIYILLFSVLKISKDWSLFFNMLIINPVVY